MKKLAIWFVALFVIALCAVLFFGSGNVSRIAWGQTEIVEGKNNPQVDVLKIQKAVEDNDRVILKGTFDFGGSGSVNIVKDVIVEGEEAKIVGGQRPISCTEKVKLKVKNICFDNAKQAAIYVTRSKQLEIEECTFTNLRPVLEEAAPGSYERINYPNNITSSIARAIMVATLPQSLADFNNGIYPSDHSNDISGKVVIKENTIEALGDANSYRVGICISGINADLEVRRNVIQNGNYVGIMLNQNAGTSIIDDNTVQTSYRGIIVGNFMGAGENDVANEADPYYGKNLYGDPYGIPMGSFSVVNNTVTAEYSSSSFGISYYDYRIPKEGATYEFKDNVITVNGATNQNTGGILLFRGAKNALWEDNIIKGIMKRAIVVNSGYGYGVLFNKYTVEDNVFRGTDLGEVTSTYNGQHVFMAGNTYNNTLKDFIGKENYVVLFYPYHYVGCETNTIDPIENWTIIACSALQ